MKGIVFTGEGAEVLTGIEVRDPGPGEVAIRVARGGITEADLLLYRQGRSKDPGKNKPSFPGRKSPEPSMPSEVA